MAMSPAPPATSKVEARGVVGSMSSRPGWATYSETLPQNKKINI
jgi:hypothetical protein